MTTPDLITRQTLEVRANGQSATVRLEIVRTPVIVATLLDASTPELGPFSPLLDVIARNLTCRAEFIADSLTETVLLVNLSDPEQPRMTHVRPAPGGPRQAVKPPPAPKPKPTHPPPEALPGRQRKGWKAALLLDTIRSRPTGVLFSELKATCNCNGKYISTTVKRFRARGLVQPAHPGHDRRDPIVIPALKGSFS